MAQSLKLSRCWDHNHQQAGPCIEFVPIIRVGVGSLRTLSDLDRLLAVGIGGHGIFGSRHCLVLGGYSLLWSCSRLSRGGCGLSSGHGWLDFGLWGKVIASAGGESFGDACES